jgi:phenylalanyl-tRNA synthetase beta chain
MLVSLAWLRSLCEIDADPAAIAAALTARGLTVDAVSAASGDTVLDIDVPANRPDCLGHLGIAREAAGAFGAKLLPRPPVPPVAGESIEGQVEVHIDDPDLCPRYTARLVRQVRIKPSPQWVVDRLEACGLRSVNNVVDVSNLVLLELGHPIHTFDLTRIEAGTIRVRRARKGETLTTLDAQECRLDDEVLVIADAERPVALAGVMGGANSEIHAGTRDVLIEAASFLPRSIRATSRRFGIKTDSSHRFERGVDPEGLLEAQDTAVRLLVELADGAPAPAILDLYPVPVSPREATLRVSEVQRLLGYDPGPEAISGALAALGLAPRPEGEGSFRLVLPTWRLDLEREADLVEEVARHLGYDQIPSTLPSSDGAPLPIDPVQEMEESARNVLARHGFHEAFNYAMIGKGEDDPFVPSDAPAAVALVNPIAEPLSHLRRSLVPAILRSLDRNLRRGVTDVRLFEVGSVFLARAGEAFPEEPLHAALAWAGAATPRHWGGEVREVDFYSAAGLVDNVLESLLPGLACTRARSTLAAVHPGRSATWNSPEAGQIAWCGELHPDLVGKLDLPCPVQLAEIDLSGLLAHPPAPRRHAPLPRVPGAVRDLSLVLGTDVRFDAVLQRLREAKAPAPVRFDVIDRYVGKPLAAREVSITVRVTLQPQEKTLTDEETEAFRQELVRILTEEMGIRLRS